jgi:hypothetical protein
MPDETSPNRIENDIAAHFPQISISIDHLGTEPPLKHMTTALMPAIESLRVDAVQVAHRQREIGLGCLEEQVIVVAHEAVGVTKDTITSHRGGQHDEKARAIVVVLKNAAMVVPTSRNVVDPAGKLQAERSRHEPTLPSACRHFKRPG